ncbi:prepilin-type N-terminal cleavage/methylation domain-containing protein [Saccharospirillum mangrovi]|uniref:prepilin-type N-terminal cleavage/methylation domain-containing protein n=1 Tax=Saccharospirillum mangrovi TaxID=2161747 RepID=UPI000D3D68AA|nr:prepilin-type N-terminal cleavage/methylation domain-containing protein [Saccharospirillum mangrovi]
MTPVARQFTGRDAGFSLIELLVVIIIIGVAASMVRLVVSQPDPLEELERSAQQLAYRFGQVQDTVLLSGDDQGLLLLADGVQFLTWRPGNPRDGEPEIVWEPNDAAPNWQAPDDTEITLYLEGQWVEIPRDPPEDARDWVPMILMFPSEDYQPSFELYLKPPGIGNDAVRVKGDGFRRLEVSRVSL